ncbi:MAG: hypothetical protein AB7K71_25730 [Polyangiaceae bacterium]
MTDFERIDLSSLDPARDPERWQLRLDETVYMAIRARDRRITVGGQIYLWTKPLLGIAAGIAAIVWTGALLSGNSETTTVEDPHATLSAWAAEGEVPTSTSRMLQVMQELPARSGDDHE